MVLPSHWLVLEPAARHSAVKPGMRALGKVVRAPEPLHVLYGPCVTLTVATAVSWTGLHTMSFVLVQTVFTPAVHVVSAAHAVQGLIPEAEKVVPAAHATWHTVSVVSVQAFLTPVVHVEPAVHFVQGSFVSSFPEAEKVVPTTHACEERRR